jgi:hypothetical protein
VEYLVEEGTVLLECGGDTEALDGGVKAWLGSWFDRSAALLIKSRLIVIDGRRN